MNAEPKSKKLGIKLLLFTVCLALLSTFTAVNVSAHPPCGKVWINGHHNRYGAWVPGHWRHRHWVHGHHNRHGAWVPGHCGR